MNTYKNILFFFLILTFSYSWSQSWVFDQKIIPDSNLSSGYFHSLAVHDNEAIFLSNDYFAYFYTFSDTSGWQKQQVITSTFANAFFYNFDFNEEYLAIGRYDYDSFDGLVTIFKKDSSGTWIETQQIQPNDISSDDYFGRCTAIHNGQLFVGSLNSYDSTGLVFNRSDAGAIYIYEPDSAGNWELFQKITASNWQIERFFGARVDISDSVMIVSSNFYVNSGYKHCYVFEQKPNRKWIETQMLLSSDWLNPDDDFGFSIAIDKNTIVISAPGEEEDEYGLNTVANSGSAYVFEKAQNGQWFQSQKLKAPVIRVNERFGVGIDIEDDKTTIGSNSSFDENESNYVAGSGAVYVFEKDNFGTWRFTNKVVSPERKNNHNFGPFINLNNSNIYVATARDTICCSNQYQRGAVYTFKLDTNWGYVQGRVFNDVNLNCVRDTSESLNLEGITVQLIPGNYTTQTNAAGYWRFDTLPIGNYTAIYDSTNFWLGSCGNSQSFSLNNSDTTLHLPEFGMYNTNPCTDPNVSMNMPFIRPCFDNQRIDIQVCNSYSTATSLVGKHLDVYIDTLIQVNSATHSYSDLGNGLYRFTLPNSIAPGQCENLRLFTTVSCNATLGQTLCMEATLLPLDTCMLDTLPSTEPSSCATAWDRSSIDVNGWCENDSIYFSITNIGSGDMSCFSRARLYIDGEYVFLDSLQLTSMQSDTLVFSGDGRTWRLEVSQHPLHPGNSNPNATVELCGTSENWTSDLVNIFPHDDFDPIKDVYCGIVTGSYDPNDKTGFPLGLTDSHFITPNQRLEYVIRFQNVGTDTAFNVTIIDTLDLSKLDIFSLEKGAASHNYTMKIRDKGVVQWSIRGALLPDSASDPIGSQGYVSFSINPLSSLTEGTEINNEADIYFDYNEPVRTNKTSHILKNKQQQIEWQNTENVTDTSCFTYNYRDLIYNKSGEYFQLKGDTLITLDLLVRDFTLNTNADTSICLGDSITFTADASVASFSWNKSVVDGQSYYLDSNDVFTLTGTDTNGCTKSDSMFVIVNELPIVETDSDTAICLNDTITLNGRGAQNYMWDNGVVNGVPFAPMSTQNYTVIGIDSNGCESSSTLAVIVNYPNLEILVTDSIICINDTITLNGVGAQSYQWDNGVQNGVPFAPSISQNYTLTGIDSLGCENTSSIAITVNALPNVQAGADSTLCLNENIVLSASGAQNYTWDNGVVDGQSFSPIQSMQYNVVGTDSNGCENVDSVYISVYDTIPQAEFSYQLTGFEVSLSDSSSNDVNSWYWSIGEDSLSNSAQTNFEFTQDGTYDVCLIASNDCFSDTLCKQITISGVGIEHKLGTGNIKVYPNPVTHQLSIELNDVNKEVTSIQLIDISGRVIDKQITNQVGNDGKIVIDVSELETGIYIYNILSKDEILGVGEILKK